MLFIHDLGFDAQKAGTKSSLAPLQPILLLGAGLRKITLFGLK